MLEIIGRVRYQINRKAIECINGFDQRSNVRFTGNVTSTIKFEKTRYEVFNLRENFEPAFCNDALT